MGSIIQNYPIVLGIVAAIFILAIIFQFFKRPRERYIKVESLFSPAELKFYKILEEVIEDYKIFGKVRVADVIKVDKDKAKGNYLKYFNKIAKKHVDFLLCDPESLEPVVAIELDDSSHESAERAERDTFMDKAFKMAQLPLLRFKVRAKYDKIEIKKRIKNATG